MTAGPILEAPAESVECSGVGVLERARRRQIAHRRLASRASHELTDAKTSDSSLVVPDGQGRPALFAFRPRRISCRSFQFCAECSPVCGPTAPEGWVGMPFDTVERQTT
jgi:hypothetical protein